MADETPVSASFIFVDRRKTGRGKSIPNRQKLLKRIQGSIRAAKPDDIGSAGVGGATRQKNQQITNPIKVTRNALNEPTFRYARNSGESEIVLPGNDRWLKGDEFPLDGDDGDDGDPSEARDGVEDGEDDFVVTISQSEFYDVFFEDCALPDMEQTAIKETPEAVMKPAGFQKDGTPGQLSIIRSYRNSLGRRRALSGEAREEIEQLQARLNELMINDDLRDGMEHSVWAAEVERITARIKELKDSITNMPLFEKLDNRYRKKERITVKSAEATLIMAMDVSGSMDEDRKRLARRFFALQYVFITRMYPDTDLVFIIHTEQAQRVSEEEFFSSRINGGTHIAPAFALARNIIKEEYDVSQTNLYFSYAGDGDNWPSDNAEAVAELTTRGLLSHLRHAVYIQIGEESNGWGSSGTKQFWTAMAGVAEKNKKLHMAKIQEDGDVFTAFKQIYSKSQKK